MKRAVLLSCWLIGAMWGTAQARECKGVQFPEQLHVVGNDLSLNGLGMRKATFLKVNVYVGALYVPHPGDGPASPAGAQHAVPTHPPLRTQRRCWRSARRLEGRV